MTEEIKIKKDRDWSEYPIGTKAWAVTGGYWIRMTRGWKWCTGDTFPTPGGDSDGTVTIPSAQETEKVLAEELHNTLYVVCKAWAEKDRSDISFQGDWVKLMTDDLARRMEYHISKRIQPLQAFKNYVHKRLDDAGVPANPEGLHSKQGCRIGDRLDILINSKNF